MDVKRNVKRNVKTESFKNLPKSGRFAKTSINDIRKAGERAGEALKNMSR
jgi:hypothetical protein